jgi:hypothetical protein
MVHAGSTRRCAPRGPTLGAVTDDDQELPAAEPPGDTEQAAEQDDDGLTVPMQRTDGPGANVLRNREAQAARDEVDRVRWQNAIEANIAAHRLALDFLDTTHQWIADTYDFDLVGDSRQAATWQMCGRCIGIARLVCDALAAGYTAEVLHLARALHEAARLAGIFTQQEGTELLRRWLADEGDEWVRPGQVRAARERFAERLAEVAREAGGPELGIPAGLERQIYGDQSQAAHHRRKWTQDAVFPEQRTMRRGPTTDWARRAATTASMLVVVEEAVMAVGDALGEFMPPGWYIEHVVPFLQTFEALRVARPLV